MRTVKEILNGRSREEFMLEIHPINGVDGYEKWHNQVLGEKYKLKNFHKNWIQPLCKKKPDRIAIAAPTGFGKTENYAIAYPLWRVWHNNTNHGDAWSGLIVSTSMTQSKKIIKRIKNTVLNNELLMEIKPSSNNKSWSTTELEFANGGSIAARPLNKNVKSYHVDYVFCDEVASYKDKNVFYKYVSTRMTSKKGQLAAVSTYEHDNDLLKELQKKESYYPIITSAVKDGKSIWPERFPTSFLKNRKKELGERAFALQYLSDTSKPLDDLTHPFPLSLLARNTDEDLMFEYSPDPEAEEYIISYDPAFSLEGDYNAIIMGKVKNGKLFLVKSHRFKGDPDQAIEIIKGWYDVFHPSKVVIDTNSGGSKIMRDASRRNLPVVSFPFSSPKRLRAFREAISYFQSGKIVLPGNEGDSKTKHMMKIFFKEMTHIATSRTPVRKEVTYESHSNHDDVAMSFIMLVNEAAKGEEMISYVRSGSRGNSRSKSRRSSSGVRRFNVITELK